MSLNSAAIMEASQPQRRHVGQGTMVEQSRAVAEVQAAVVVAQQRPRDTTRALGAMREATGIGFLADRAFFRYSRGGSQVTGPSVHLARELARCWGNIDYGHKELARDDERGQSEMLAFAWDLETNARSEVTFIVPHARDVKGGPKRLTEMRDIYENNANNAARRLRECIFAVLPVWFTEEAKELCRKTLEHGGGKPLAQRAADCVAAFETIGVVRAQLERKIGRAADGWIAEDVAALGIIYKSIRAGETSKDEEFPREEGDPVRAVAPDADAFERASAGVKETAPKATEKEPARADPETGEVTSEAPAQGATDWPAEAKRWCQTLKACQTLNQIENILKQYGAAMQQCHEQAPDVYDQVMEYVGKRQDSLGEKAEKAKAEQEGTML